MKTVLLALVLLWVLQGVVAFQILENRKQARVQNQSEASNANQRELRTLKAAASKDASLEIIGKMSEHRKVFSAKEVSLADSTPWVWFASISSAVFALLGAAAIRIAVRPEGPVPPMERAGLTIQIKIALLGLVLLWALQSLIAFQVLENRKRERSDNQSAELSFTQKAAKAIFPFNPGWTKEKAMSAIRGLDSGRKVFRDREASLSDSTPWAWFAIISSGAFGMLGAAAMKGSVVSKKPVSQAT